MAEGGLGSLGVLGEALIVLHADLDKLKDELKKAKPIVTGAVKEITDSLEKTGKAFSVGLSLPIVAVGVAALEAGLKVEKVLDTIRVRTGATGERLDSLKKSFQEVFRNVPASAQAVADAIGILNARLGLTGEPLEKVATALLNVTRLTKTELVPVAEEASRMFKIWNVSTDNQVKSLDMLFKVSQKTGANFGELVSNVVAGAPAFKQLGFNMEQSAALLGKFEQAGVSSGRVLAALRIAAIKVGDKEGLTELIAKMKALGPGAEQARVAQQAFGRGAAAMVAAINQGAFSIDGFIAALKADGETIAAATDKTDHFAEKFIKLKNRVEDALAPIGTTLLHIMEDRVIPMLTVGVEWVEKLSKAFEGLSDPVKEATVMFFGTLAVLGPSFLALRKLILGYVELKEALLALKTVEKGSILLSGGAAVAEGVAASGAAGAVGSAVGGAAAGGAAAAGAGAAASGGILASLTAGPGAPIVLGVLALAAALFILKSRIDDVSDAEKRNAAGPGLPGGKAQGTPGTALAHPVDAKGNPLITTAQASQAGSGGLFPGAMEGGAVHIGPVVVDPEAAAKTQTLEERMASLKDTLEATREKINKIPPAFRALAISALEAGVPAKDVQTSLRLDDEEMGVFTKMAEQAKEAQKKLTKSNEEFAAAAANTGEKIETLAAASQRATAISDALGTALYESIKAGHDAGIGNEALATRYKVTTAQVEQVVKAEAEYQKQLDDATSEIDQQISAHQGLEKAMDKAFEGQPEVLKNMASTMSVFRDVTDETGKVVGHGLVSGTLLASHAIEGLNQQVRLVPNALEDLEGAIQRKILQGARDFMPLDDALKQEIKRAHELGMSAEEIAERTGLSVKRVIAEVTTAWEVFESVAVGLADNLTQLAQVSGGSFGGVVKDIAEVAVAFKTAKGAADAYRDASQLQGSSKFVGRGMAALEGITAVASATSSGSMGKRIAGGAISGAEFGFSVAGPWGAAVGAGIGALTGWLRGRGIAKDNKKIATDLGLEFGTTFSDETRKAIAASKKSGKTQAVAELLNLDKILADVGGLTAKNFAPLTERLSGMLDKVRRGEMSAADASDVMDKHFTEFAQKATSNSGILHSKLVELVKMQGQMGINSPALSEFLKVQGGNVLSGVGAALAPAHDAYTQLVADQKALAALTDKAGQSEVTNVAKIADLRAKMAKADDAHRAVYQQEIDKLRGDASSTESQIDDLRQKIEDEKAVLAATALTPGGGAAAAGAILAGVGTLQAQGVDYVTALKAAEPAVTELKRQLDELGVDGGEAFNNLAADVALVSDKIAGPALQAAAGWGQALVGLNNSGRLTQEMFSGLAGQIAATRDRLVAQGKDGGAVLRALSPELQQIWEIEKNTGMSVDDTTQALVDEAEKAGMVGEKFVGPQQQMIDALNHVGDLLTAIGRKLGADLPADARAAADGVNHALDGIHDQDVNVDLHYNDPGFTQGLVANPGGQNPEYNPGGGTPAYNPGGESAARNGGRITSNGLQYFDRSGIVRPNVFAMTPYMRPRGFDTVGIMASPGELIMNVAHQVGVATTIKQAADLAKMQLERGDRPIELDMTFNLLVGDKVLGTVTEKVTWPQLQTMFRQDGGKRREAQLVLGIK